MSGSVDRFAAFVDVLAEAMDDHESRGAELARRVHLSRFHLDRIVATTAGETPSRLRRRVLLERAAYRLVTSRRTVLDIGVEAGYGSHEAFTRAFARAYGDSPVRWRRRPTNIQLAAPSGVHFHPPGSLRLPARVEVSSMDLMVKIVEHHVWLVGEYVDHAQRLGDATLDAPIEITVDDDNTQTLRGLLSRLVGQMDMWLAAIETRDYDFDIESGERIDDMRSRLDRVGPAFVAQVREVCDQGRLDETFVDALCEPAHVFTYGGMIAHVVTFAAYRRTLVALALDHAGITDLGWGDPMHWVAEPV